MYNRLWETEVRPSLPLVDGVRVYAQHLCDLRSSGQVLCISHVALVEVRDLLHKDRDGAALPSSPLALPSEMSYSSPGPCNVKTQGWAPHMTLPAATPERATELSHRPDTIARMDGRWSGSDLPEPYSEGTNQRGSFWKLYQGDCRKILQDLPEGSVNCVVTSPPYFWQRDYQTKGQFGQEPTIQGFVDNLRETFQGLHRVLSEDGVVWLNLGDTYYSAKGRPHGRDAKHRGRRLPTLRAVDGPGLGLPRKSLIGIPWRVALALQDDGWTLRSDIIWLRESSIPEPTARDRPWRKHEHIFLFAKSTRYYFNRQAIAGEEDVWTIEPERNSPARGTHYAPFPRELVRRCIAAGCPAGGVVLDPFVGGGTAMSVALEAGYHAIGVELSHEFCGHVTNTLHAETARATLDI